MRYKQTKYDHNVKRKHQTPEQNYIFSLFVVRVFQYIGCWLYFTYRNKRQIGFRFLEMSYISLYITVNLKGAPIYSGQNNVLYVEVNYKQTAMFA